MSESRYAVPLSVLDARVPLAEQSTEHAVPRPEIPLPWAMGAGAVPAAGGGPADGDGD